MSEITRVGLVAKRRLAEAATVITELAQWLEWREVRPVYEADTAAIAGISDGAGTFTRDELPRECDLVVVLGGDGTLIGMAGRIAEAGTDVPILGVNFGSLGFLTEVTLTELYASLESVLDGTAQIDERMLLRSTIRRDDRVVVDRFALNDVVITKGAMARIIDLAVAVGGQPVMRVRADGLIVASPTGSTAYNLAAGGPILHPAVDAFLLTPIAPHMLTNRPIAIPASSVVRVEAVHGTSSDELYVTIDGQFGHPLEAGEVVFVARAERPLLLVRAATRTYFDVLREKLKWSE
jgi:NAD+ kinase